MEIITSSNEVNPKVSLINVCLLKRIVVYHVYEITMTVRIILSVKLSNKNKMLSTLGDL